MAMALVANSKLKVAYQAPPSPPPPSLIPAAGTQLWRRTHIFLRAEDRKALFARKKKEGGELPALRCRRTAPGEEDDKKDSLGTGVAEIFPSETPGSSFPLPPVGRILWSDVAVKRRRKVYRGRLWNALDVGTAGVVLSMHALCLFAPFAFSWGALWTAVVLYFVTGLLGITLSFHRNLAHHSFRLPKWLEYTFAYCGVQALQGNPLDWVSTHRYHHLHCDSERDPHSPIEGFWFSHVNWLFDTASVVRRCGEPTNVGDLGRQPFYRFLRHTYVIHPIALALLLYALGGFPYLVWGMGVRIVWVYHVTWLVNSACHVWGHQAWNTGDLSRNNWWVAVLAFGEGWHNNHHAFEYSARHGLKWWQVDTTWYVVRLLQALGVATAVRLPSRAHVEKLRKHDLDANLDV